MRAVWANNCASPMMMGMQTLSNFFFCYCFEHNLRPNARRVSHRDADAWQNSPRSRSRVE